MWCDKSPISWLFRFHPAERRGRGRGSDDDDDDECYSMSDLDRRVREKERESLVGRGASERTD